jgi:hypothetical protein
VLLLPMKNEASTVRSAGEAIGNTPLTSATLLPVPISYALLRHKGSRSTIWWRSMPGSPAWARRCLWSSAMEDDAAAPAQRRLMDPVAAWYVGSVLAIGSGRGRAAVEMFCPPNP